MRGRVREGAAAGHGGRNWTRRHVSGAKLSNGLEQHAPVAYRRHADVLQIIGRQLRQHCPIDFVIAEGGLVSLETQAAQPRRYVHRRLPLTLVYPPRPPGKIQFAVVLWSTCGWRIQSQQIRDEPPLLLRKTRAARRLELFGPSRSK